MGKKAKGDAADAKAKKKADKKKDKKKPSKTPDTDASGTTAASNAQPSGNDLFELGRYIERHLGGKNGAVPSPSTSTPGSAGFLDALSQFSALSEQEFANMMIGLRRKKKAEEAKVHTDPKSRFEAGRLFERFDRNQDGNIDKVEFLRMMEQLDQQPPVTLSTASSTVSKSSNDNFDEGLVWQRALHPNPNKPIAVHPNLMLRLLRKKEQLVFQMRALQARMERCRACKRVVERDTVMDTQAILRRLGQAEAFKLSILQNDFSMLEKDVEAIKSFVKHVSSNDPMKALHSSKVLGMGLMPNDMGPRWLYDEESSLNAAAAIAASSASVVPPSTSQHTATYRQPYPSPLATSLYSKSSSGTSDTVNASNDHVNPVEFIRLYPELCDMAQRLIEKEFNQNIDVAFDDFPEEMRERRERADVFEEALGEMENMKEKINILTRQLFQAKKQLNEQKRTMDQQAGEYSNLSLQAAESLEEASKEMDTLKNENVMFLDRIKELEEELARRDNLEKQDRVMAAYNKQQQEQTKSKELNV